MIYGYWWEKEQDLINSMETLRQFYENALLDSCFWHKFVLTRHSRAYNEWKGGKIPDLKPIDPQEKKNAPLFAKNGLHFEGEKSSEKYGASLDYSLNQWMHGEGIEKPVQKWFDFQVARPNVSKDFISKLIEAYEKKRDEEFAKDIALPYPISQNNKGNKRFGDFKEFLSSLYRIKENKKIFWLGTEIISLPNNKIGWFYMGEFYAAKQNSPISFFRGKGLCLLR
jgi:hypothetical protein